MSVVTIQLGQCGNQVGADLLNFIAHDAVQPPRYSKMTTKENLEFKEKVFQRFFTERSSLDDVAYEAKAVMVDMEPKVINTIRERSRKSGMWSYNAANQYIQRKGSGNNWALGYHQHGPKALDDVMNIVRKEVEKCNYCTGFLVIMSLAGGTGSGLGAFLSHALQDHFPNQFLVNQVIWPYTTGEVILQNYNTVLTLSQLYQSSDAIIILQNDHLNKICTKQLCLKEVSLNDINSIISHKLASILLPSLTGIPDYSPYVSNCLGEMVHNLCSHPSYKLLSVKNIPYMVEKSLAYSTYVWPALVKHLRQMLIADSPMEEGIDWEVRLPSNTAPSKAEEKEGFPVRKLTYNKSLANMLIARGREVDLFDSTAFRNPQLYVPWTQKDNRLTVWTHPRPFNQYEKSLTLLTNSQSCIKPMESVVTKAWNTFAARAYFHQYERYGMTEDDFVDSIGSVEQIISDYSEL